MQLLKTYLFIILLILIEANYFAHSNSIIDSLNFELKTAKGTEKVALFIALSKSEKDNLEESENYAQKGLKLAKDIDDWAGQIDCLARISSIYSQKNDSPQALKYILEAIQISENHEIKSLGKGGLHYQVGINLEQIGAYKEAIEHRIKQAKWNRINNNIADEYSSITAVGSLYFRIKNYTKSREYFLKCIELANELSSQHFLAHANNNIGLTYLKSIQLDSAKSYFEKALILFETNKNASNLDSLMVGIVSGNLSECYISKKDLNIAKKLLQEDIRLCKKYKDTINLINSYVKLSELNRRFGNYRVAKIINDSAQQLMVNHNKGQLQLRIYKNFINIYLGTNEVNNAEVFMNKYLELNDSIYGPKMIDNITQTRSIYHLDKINYELEVNRLTLEKNKKELALLKHEDKITRLKMFGSLGLVIMILIIVIIIFYKLRSDHSKKMQIQKINEELINVQLRNKELESIQLQEDLENKNEELTNYAIEITKNHEFVQRLRDELKELKNNGKGDTEEYMKLLNQVNSQLSVEDQLREFQRKANSIHKNFNSKLSEMNKSLTKNELYLCGVLRLNLTNKDIAIIRNVSEKAVRMSKYRLKMKLGLSKEQNLGEFLNNLK